jgi:hypothetical protein
MSLLKIIQRKKAGTDAFQSHVTPQATRDSATFHVPRSPVLKVSFTPIIHFWH